MHQQNKFFKFKVKFRQASNHCKRFLVAAKRPYAHNTKESITSQNLGSRSIWRIANSVFNKCRSVIPTLFNDLEVLFSASEKAKLLSKNFSRNSNLDDSGISLPVFFFSKTNLKLHIISVTSMLVKKVISYLNLPKTSGPDIVLVVVLSNCEPELFNICLKESCFPDC